MSGPDEIEARLDDVPMRATKYVDPDAVDALTNLVNDLTQKSASRLISLAARSGSSGSYLLRR